MPAPLGSFVRGKSISKALAGSRLRGPIASVGEGVCQYGPSDGYATPGMVRGYTGPPADALQRPTRWYVRATGSNNNGGSSASVERSGSDGVTNATTTFTSASAAFTSADVGKGICVGSGASARRHLIVSVTNATTVVLDRASSNTSGLAWVIGGAWADPRAAFGDAAVSGDSNSPVRSGDSVVIGAGTYRQVVTLANWAPAFNGQVAVVGDVDGRYTGDAGMVRLTSYLTSDKVAPSSNSLLSLVGRSNIAFANIYFVGGNAATIGATTATSQNISFRDCAFYQMHGFAGRVFQVTGSAWGIAHNWLIDRCLILHAVSGAGTGVILDLPLATGGLSDFDDSFAIQNSTLISFANGQLIAVEHSGSATGKGGGLRVRNCLLLSAAGVLSATNLVSTVFPCRISNSLIHCGSAAAALTTTALGNILEQNNLIVAATPRTNVAVGAGSISNDSYAALLHFGQERIWSGLLRAFSEPMDGSPLLGFGNDGAQTLYDAFGRPRPAGGGSFPTPAVGALERGSTAVQATSPAPPTGTYDWQFTGPGYQEFLLPVSALSTTLSVKVQRTSAYSPPPGATLPALQILANQRLGIPAQTIVDAGAAGGWNTLTAAAFTPTGTGWVTVRLASFDGTGLGVVSFANLLVT